MLARRAQFELQQQQQQQPAGPAASKLPSIPSIHLFFSQVPTGCPSNSVPTNQNERV